MADYRYRHLTFRTLLHDMRCPSGSPAPGEPFPDFDLPTTAGGRLRRADLGGQRPMFIVAASFT